MADGGIPLGGGDHDGLLHSEAMIDRSPAVAIRWRLDDDFTVEFVTRNVSRLGYSREDLLSGRVTWAEITHPDDLPRLRAELEGLLAAGAMEFGQNYRILDASGQVHWVEDYNQFIRDADGRVTHVEGLAWDVTDRKEAESALRRSEQEYRGLFEGVPVGVYRSTPDGRLLQANPALKRMFGYLPTDALPPVNETYVHPDDRRRWCNLIERKGTVRDFEVELRRKDGGTFWARDMASVVRDEDGGILFYEGWLEDVTDRKLAEIALKDSEEKYRRLFETETDAIMIYDAETLRLMDANDSMLRMYGYTREEALTLKILDVSAELEKTLAYFEQALAGKVWQVPFCYHRKKDGTVFPVEIAASSFMLNGRRVLCGAIRDITDRVRAEEELRRSENMLAESQRIARLGSWDRDMVNETLRWSSETYRIFGVDEKTYVPSMDGFVEMIHPDDRQRVCEAVAQSLDAPVPYSVEHRIIRPDGIERIVHEQGRVYFDDQGQSVRVIGTVFDVTDHRRAEQALRASEAKYRSLAENTSDIVYSMDAEGRLTYVSPQTARYGRAPEECVGRPIADFVLPEDRPRVLADFEKAIANGKEFPTELRLLDSDGQAHWFEERGNVLRDEAGNVTGITGILRDITDRKHLEDERDWIARQLDLALDAAELGWWRVDPSTWAMWWDDRLGEIFGCPGGQSADGQELISRVHPDDVDCMWAEMDLALNPEDPKPYEMEYRLVLPDGTTRWVEVHGVASFEGEGEDRHAVMFVGTAQDITERKEIEAQREWYQEKLRQLAMELGLAEERERQRLAVILHDDVAQLIVAAKFRLGMLEKTPDQANHPSDVTRISEMLARVLRTSRSLTSQLSHPALYQYGLASAAEWLAKDIEELHGLAVTVDAPPGDDPIDRRLRVLLFQCIRELLVNAAKHAQADAATVRIEWEDRQVRAVVSDGGRGFDTAEVERDASDGGFGLFSIRERLAALGGKMEISSRTGKGTSVTLTVPMTVPPRPGRQNPQMSPCP